MRHSSLLRLLIASTALTVGAFSSYAQEPDGVAPRADSLQARVWLDRGEEPVLQRGDEVRVYYRTSEDAFAAIFRIDTDGRVSLLFPQHPGVDPYVGGNSDYRLLFPDATRWEVREDPGVGYLFMVASPVPLDFSAFAYDPERGWDLGAVAASVYDDPYVAIDDFVAAILPDWASTPYALDFLSYDVGERHDYPRFLCYDCHGFQSYSTWDPYAYTCSSYRVVVWSDPYFIPRYRYAGTRVVFARPFGPRPRYAVTRRAPGSTSGPLYRLRAAPPRLASYKEPARTPSRRRPSGVVPDRRSPPSVRGGAPATGRSAPPARAGAPSSGVTSGRAPSGAAGATRGRQPVDRSRPTLQRRGPAQRSPAAGNGRASPGRRGVGAPSARPSRSPAGARSVPGRRPTGSVRPGGGARTGAPARGQPARPTRPPARAAPTRRPTGRSGGPVRAAPTRRPTGRSGGPVRSGPTRRRGGGTTDPGADSPSS